MIEEILAGFKLWPIDRCIAAKYFLIFCFSELGQGLLYLSIRRRVLCYPWLGLLIKMGLFPSHYSINHSIKLQLCFALLWGSPDLFYWCCGDKHLVTHSCGENLASMWVESSLQEVILPTVCGIFFNRRSRLSWMFLPSGNIWVLIPAEDLLNCCDQMCCNSSAFSQNQ